MAEIAHALRPLTPRQRAEIDAAAKSAPGLARYAEPGDAFFPLAPRGTDVSPLLPFYISPRSVTAARKSVVVVAWTKLRHAPYDVIAVLWEQIDGRWRLVSIASIVDH